MLSVNKVTGAYSFLPNVADIEAMTDAASTSFAVTVSDGSLTRSKTLTINIAQDGTTEFTGNDRLTGTAGNDKFDGLAGNDIINGLEGADIMKGGSGGDLLKGGKGKDNLTGGLGAETFKFNTVAETGMTGNSRDIIVDFKHSQGDKIDLSAIDANTALTGNNAFSAPTVSGTFSGVFANILANSILIKPRTFFTAIMMKTVRRIFLSS